MFLLIESYVIAQINFIRHFYNLVLSQDSQARTVALLPRVTDLFCKARKARDPQSGQSHLATVMRTTLHLFRHHQVCEAHYQCSSRSLASRPNNRHRNCCFFLQNFSFLFTLCPLSSSTERKISPSNLLTTIEIFRRYFNPNFRDSLTLTVCKFAPVNSHTAS